MSEYFPYLCNMKTVFLKKGNVHGIYAKVPHPRSYAAAILLGQYYQRLEDDAYASMTFDINAPIPEHYVKNWKVRLAFNTQFLEKTLASKGVLTCVYCGKTDLIVDCSDRNKLATADHFIAVSKGGHPFDESNLVVACYRCNNRKGSGTGILAEDGTYSFVRDKKKAY